MAITNFRGEYFFLSNFFPVEMCVGGIIYPTLEHAYVAAKTNNEEQKRFIQTIETPGLAKKYGRSEDIELVPFWNDIKITVMKVLIAEKFKDGELLNKLLATEGQELIEGNQHHDTFWGECPLGNGKNMLGKILMEHRNRKLLFA